MNHNKDTLNDIIKNFQDIELLILESGGEISEEIENKLSENDNDLSNKLDGYEKFSRYLKGQVNYLREVEEQYSKRRKIIDNSIKRLRDRMLNALLVTGKKSLKTIEHNYSVSESEKWSLDLDTLSDKNKSTLINDGLAENIFKANLNDIKSKYKNQDIPNWINIEKNQYLKVK